MPIAAVMRSEESGADGQSNTWWKSDTVRFVFGHLNVGNSNTHQRQTQRWRLRMCISCAAGVCRGL